MSAGAWLAIFLAVNVPIVTLLVDRMFDVPAPRWIRTVWPAAAVLFVAGLAAAGGKGDPLLPLVGWGALAGLLGTVLLDAVRLFGVHALNAFPADMPQIFGVIATGLAPGLQANMIAEMVAGLAALPDDERRRMLRPRMEAIAAMPEPRRLWVVQAMLRALGRLPEGRREEVRKTQLEVLAALPEPDRRVLVQAMDHVMLDGGGAARFYGQPRRMPRIPMAAFREMFERALPATLREAGVPMGRALAAGYLWHVLNGVGFGVSYALLFGRGSWGLALAWGLFIWAGMMAAMPVMMPVIAFPWPRFLAVPLVAHVAMILPYGWIGLTYVSADAGARSLLAALIR